MASQLFFRKQGSGFPLILMHGNGEDGSSFSAQLEHFSVQYTVYALDTRGHGKSPRGTAPFTFDQFAEDLKEFMDDQRLERAHVLGFSDGAITALLFALKYPQRVEKLILNGANLDFDGLMPEVKQGISAAEQKAAAHKDEGPEAFRKYELLHLMASQPPIDPKRLNDLQVRTLVIAGTDDMIKPEHTQLIADSLPNAVLKIIEGTHFIAYENPDEFDAAVEEFLAE